MEEERENLINGCSFVVLQDSPIGSFPHCARRRVVRLFLFLSFSSLTFFIDLL